MILNKLKQIALNKQDRCIEVNNDKINEIALVLKKYKFLKIYLILDIVKQLR